MQAAVRFAAAGDLMHASNVRYMLAQRAVEAGERLAEVPVWLDECESFAASHGYRHELAHIHLVRAAYERRQDRLDGARELLGDALTAFRQAGDLRCVTRTLLELARSAGRPARGPGQRPALPRLCRLRGRRPGWRCRSDHHPLPALTSVIVIVVTGTGQKHFGKGS
jgi:hypothetical protein